MAPSGSKRKLKAAELEAAILNRLREKHECESITHVYIKPTGKEPPEDTWAHTLISRRTDAPRTQAETRILHDLLNEMRKEIDLIPD
jgi:hypothetical protein